jgi:hypothetical protein
MSKSAKAPEPSMEEILASIRRIIADEGNAVNQPAAKPAAAAPAAPSRPTPPAAPQAAAPSPPPRAPAVPPPAAGSDVLDLDQPVAPAPAGFTPVRGSDVMFREGERQRPAAPPPSAPVPRPPAAPAARPPLMVEDDLLSPDATAAVSAAFGSLAHTILSENARTLEDLVREMMRPMLKEWLDENLPGLVARLVRAEIERVARGGR